jgi:hypothetical protein
MAAILDSPFTPASESLHSSLTVLINADSVGMAVGFPLPATIQDLLFELHVFPVLHPPFLFPVEHGWNSARCSILSGGGDLSSQKLAKQPCIRSHG